MQAMLLYIQCTSRLEVNGPLFFVSDSYTSRPLTTAQFAKHLSWAYRYAIPVDSIRLIGDWRSNAYQQYIAVEEPLIARA